MRRPTGWKRWFTITTRNIGGEHHDCWEASLHTHGNHEVIRVEVKTSEDEARKAMEWHARQLAKVVRRCMALETPT